MSRYGKAASVLASAGVIAAGWSIGTAGGDTLALDPTTTSTVTTTATATQTVTETATEDEVEATETESDDSDSDDDDSTTTTTPTATSTATATTTTASRSGGSTATGTFTGTTATNRFGTVTVTVTLSNGTITDVTAAAVANDGKSQQIVQRALPILKQAVLAAQSADISTVGGATYTSNSYITSLQSALDQA